MAAAATASAAAATASAVAGAIADAEAKAVLAHGPVAGSLRHETGNTTIEIVTAPGTFMADLIVEARFFNPYGAEEHSWDYGFLFRDTEASEYRVYVKSDARWSLELWSATDGHTIIASGDVAGLNLEAGRSNVVRLVARDDGGWLLVNGNVVATLDLSAITTGGQVAVGTGFWTGDERAGAETRYEAWSVWNVIEPAAGTATAVAAAATANAATATASAIAAEIAEVTANAELAFGPADGSMTGIQLAPGIVPSEMIAEVRLFNPALDEAPNWNYGIIFRFASGSQYSVTLNVSGIWALLLTSMTESSAVVATGRVDHADLDAGGSNVIKIVTRDDRGWLLINDVFVAELDLSAVPTGGQVGIVGLAASGPATIRYEGLSIWKVVEPAQRTATAAAAAASASAAAVDAAAAATAIVETEAQAMLAFGPKDGRLLHVEAGDGLSLEVAPVTFSPDLIVEARFFNPFDPSEHPWDHGFLFRFDGTRNYRLFLDSFGRWNLDLWTGTGATPVASGEAPGADLSAGGSNVLRVVARGEQGWLLINGDYVATLDLSAVPTGSQLAIGTGFRIGDERDGDETRYEDWSVWNIVETGARTATAAAAATTTAETAAMATTAAGVDATAIAQAQPIWGPTDGSLAHVPENGQIDYWPVSLPVPTDFIAETTFFSPYDAATLAWDFGMFFRGGGTTGPFGIVVDSSRHWEFVIGRSTGWQSLAGGEVPSLDDSPLGSNVLRLVVQGDEGYFFVNGTFVARLDLAEIKVGGGFGVGLDFRPGRAQAGAVTRFQDLTIWALVEPAAATATVNARQHAEGTAFAVATEVAARGTVVAGPSEGSLTHDPAATAVPEQWADVRVQDFVVEARFYNPYDRLAGVWDYGFGFRETAFNQQYFVSLDADGVWQLVLVEGSVGQPRFTTAASGQIERIDDSVDGHNDLRLVVRGGTADFYVNNRFVATVDVSARIVAGRVSVGTGYAAGRLQAGAATRYEGFTIWSLDQPSAGDAGASPRALEPTPTPTGTPTPTPTASPTPTMLPPSATP